MIRFMRIFVGAAALLIAVNFSGIGIHHSLQTPLNLHLSHTFWCLQQEVFIGNHLRKRGL